MTGDSLHGIVFHRVPVIRGASVLKILSFALSAASLLKKESFDIVHSFERTFYHDLYRAGDGCHQEWLLNRHRASPLHRPLDAVNPRHRAILALQRQIFTPERSMRVIANSMKTRQEIIRHYDYPEDRIIVVYNGVDLDRFHPRNRDRLRAPARAVLGLTPDDLVLLFVGSGFERKGLSGFLHGAAWALSRHPKIPLKLIVAGKGNPRPYLALAHTLGLHEKVRFVGAWATIEELYAAADVFVLPTLYDSFANVTLEAAAAGLPILTSRQNGASELFEDGRNGLLVNDPVDVSEMGEKLLELFDADRRRTLGGAAREVAVQFPVSRYAQGTLHVYRTILEEKA
jgi:UDP-glucose:(heptosyl)LPS alpha-1,3-glucosyltransferase